jgi:acetyl esterase/lipase
VHSLGRTTAAGLAFISADYRLLPPCTGHDVLKDVVDLFAFLARTPTLGSVRLDATRLAVAGSSAGGMCAFLAAIHATPRPLAVLSLYGLGGDVFVSAILFCSRAHAGVSTTFGATDPAVDPALPRSEDGAVLPWLRDTRSCAVHQIFVPCKRRAVTNRTVRSCVPWLRLTHARDPI